MPETKRDCPFWKRESFWFSVLGVIVATPEAIDYATPFFPDEWKPALRMASGFCFLVAIQFGRKPGAQAREALPVVQAQVENVEQQVTEVKQAVQP